MNKFLKISGGIVLFFLVSLILVGKYAKQIQEYRYNWEAEQFQKLIDQKQAKLDEVMRNDTYGGKTPEETFDLFLDALSKGDVELASKYYDVKVQEKALEGLNKEVAERGNLEQSFSYSSDVRKGVKSCVDINTDYGGCVFEFEVERGIESISFSLNKFNQNWKISSLQ